MTVSRPVLLPGDTVTVTLQARDAVGHPMTSGGATVTFSAGAGTSSGTFSSAIDHGDGTYSANFIGTAVGPAFTIASTVDGEAVATPQPTLRVVGFTRIAAAGATSVGAQTTTGGYTCGIITTGDMYCWGVSWFGVRGDGVWGPTEPGLAPTLVAGGHQWVDVAAGNYFACSLANDGIVYCWGDGDLGQIGNGLSGNPPDVRSPVAVQGTTQFQSVSINVGYGVCALAVSGAAKCWGGNSWGRIGNGTEALSAVPADVSGGLTFAAVATSFSGSCGVTTDGAAYCWGASTLLGLGGAPAPATCAGPSACAKTPVAVSGGHTFRPIIAMHGNVVCAVTTSDQTYCWGIGHLGNGTVGSADTPVLVSGGLAFSSLTAGDGFHCGTVVNDTAYCWGANHNGNPGNGATTNTLVPTPIAGEHVFLQLSAAQDHTCGVATDGHAYCWGGNDQGELGDRSTTPSVVPVRVRLFS